MTNSYISTLPCEQEEEEEASGEVEECLAEVPVTRYFTIMCNMKRHSTCPFAITPYLYGGGKKPCPGSKHYMYATYVCN